MPGSPVNRKYETDNADVVNIRVATGTTGLTIDGVANDESTGDRTAGFPSAKVSGGRRTIGINARTVTIKFTAAKTGYKTGSPITLPALTEAFYDKCITGEIGTYLGTACEVIGRSPEVIK